MIFMTDNLESFYQAKCYKLFTWLCEHKREADLKENLEHFSRRDKYSIKCRIMEMRKKKCFRYCIMKSNVGQTLYSPDA